MAIVGVFTNVGIQESIDASLDTGFFIKPLRFGVSNVPGVVAPTRTGPNAGEWYTGNVDSRVVVDSNTVKIVCVLPPGILGDGSNEEVKEIYLYAENSSAVEFLLALGQPTENIIYDDAGTVTLELQISLVDIDLTANYLFTNTVATELETHRYDPNSHPEIIAAMAEAGIFLPAGTYPFQYTGQFWEEPVEFDGVKASQGPISGVTFTAKYNGTEGNSISLDFDGVLTVDQVITAWNNDNPDNMVTHDGVGTEVLTPQTVNLGGGSYAVADRDIVYRDTDGVYKRAIADGTIAAKASGICFRDKRRVIHSGLAEMDMSSFSVGDTLFLSSTVLGKLSTLNNGIGMGVVLKGGVDGQFLFTGFNANADVNVSQTFDAVVTDVAGIGLYATTQDALDAIPNNGRILHDKLEDLSAVIAPGGKTFELVFNNETRGWRKFAGTAASFKVDFDQVPDNGTWRIEWNGQESADLPFNANAAAIEAEFNLFAGHTGVTVTGDYSVGFTFTFLDEVPQPLPTFLNAGLNEIQRFDFGNVPDDGTITFEHEGNPTLNFPWDDNATDLKAALEALPSIEEVSVTGSFAAQYFEIEFTGSPYDKSGLQPQTEITVIATDLAQGVTPTTVNGTTVTPINPVTVQQGKYKANNLRVGPTDVVITTTELSAGAAVGPDTAIILDAPNVKITGKGFIQDFSVGIDVNDQDGTVIDVKSVNTTTIIEQGDKLPGLEIDTSSMIGYAKDIFAQLKITEHPSNKKRVKISAADVVLPSGVKLIQELDSLKMKLDGGEIDFETGLIYESDGATPLGDITFTPVIPSATNFRFASITCVPFQATNGELEAQFLVLFGDSEAASIAAAPKAPWGTGKPIGQVVLEGDLGVKEKTRFIFGRDEFSDYDTQGVLLYDAAGSVAFWADVDDSGTGIPAWASAADRAVEVTGIVENDDPNAVAAAFHSVINGDAAFTATISDNRVEVEDAVLGDRTDASTVFPAKITVDVLVQGRDTDPTGLVDIKNSAIYQLGTGSGGGGGIGDVTELLTRMFDSHRASIYKHLYATVFKSDQDTYVDNVNTTASFSYVDRAYSFGAAGQVLQTLDFFTKQYLDGINAPYKPVPLADVSKVRLDLYYGLAAVDGTPIVTISRDKGNEFQAVAVERIGESDLVSALHEFTEEATNQLVASIGGAQSTTVDLDGTNDLNRQFTLADASFIKKVSVNATVSGAPLGTLRLAIIRDDGLGDPSTDDSDVMYLGDILDASALASGLIEATLALPLEDGDYHLVVLSDQTYKDEYTNSAGANKIEFDSDGTGLIGDYEGREYGLIIKVENTDTDVILEGISVRYQEKEGLVSADESQAPYVKTFDGQVDNLNEFTIPFRADKNTIAVFDHVTGDIWRPGLAFYLTDGGSKVVFPTNTFNREGTVTLEFLNLGKPSNASASALTALLQENGLGSADPTISQASNGLGPIVLSDDGVLGRIKVNAAKQIIFEPI